MTTSTDAKLPLGWPVRHVPTALSASGGQHDGRLDQVAPERLVDGDQLVGVSNLRHKLNEDLKRAGGHIGLGIRPSRRGMGASRVLLSLTIAEARLMGIDCLHIHCHENNRASSAMIEGAGGELVDILSGDPGVKRYIITR